jgi:hypothetical protein
LTTLFQIESGSFLNETECILAMQAGKNYFSYSVIDRAGNQLNQLRFYTLESWNQGEVQAIIEELPLPETVGAGVEIAYDFNDFTLMPVAGFEESKLMEMHGLLHPFPGDVSFKAESLAEWQLYIGYAVPSILSRALESRYPSARIRHSLKLALQQAGPIGTQGKMMIAVKPSQFFVTLIRNNRLLLAKEFSYENPADVLYYLLKICEDNLISPKEVLIELTGLIEQESSLYRELWQYFAMVEFRSSAWTTPHENYPAHYFTTLNDLAKCAL